MVEIDVEMVSVTELPVIPLPRFWRLDVSLWVRRRIQNPGECM